MAQGRTADRVIQEFFFFCALLSILTAVVITVFIMLEGLPLFFEAAGGWDPPSLGEFRFGTHYCLTERSPVFGIASVVHASSAS